MNVFEENFSWGENMLEQMKLQLNWIRYRVHTAYYDKLKVTNVQCRS